MQRFPTHNFLNFYSAAERSLELITHVKINMSTVWRHIARL